MPYKKEDLEHLDLNSLRTLYKKILAHKTALKDEDLKKSNLEKSRISQVKEKKRPDLIFDSHEYSYNDNGSERGRKPKVDYLVGKILAVQNIRGIGFYDESKKLTDYKKLFEKEDINQGSGRIIPAHEKKEVPKLEVKEEEKPEPEKPAEQPAEQPKEKSKIKQLQEKIIPRIKKEFNEAHKNLLESEHSLQFSSSPEDIFENQKDMFESIIDMHKYLTVKDEEQKKKLKSGINSLVKSYKKEMENDQYNPRQILKIHDTLKSIKKLEPEVHGEESVLNDAIKYFEEHEKVKEAPKQIEEEEKHLEHLLGGEEHKEELPAPVRPAPQPVAPEPPNPKSPPSQQEEEMQMVQFDQSTLTSKGDKNIGNVRSIGFLAPMEELAKEDDVLLDETERSKSIKRFTNFRWVQSRQNSSLGDASPFQNMEDIENKRRYGKCFIPVNKMPKPEPTEEELEKFKNFNKYNLVPSYGLDSISQPATEYSFKTSQSKFARKIGIDDEQFGNKKYYSFGEGRKPNKPDNPFNASHGMEPYNQAKRNADPKDNTLEYSSILYEDDPFKRKHKFIQRAKLFYA
jgi:hypothetical protein